MKHTVRHTMLALGMGVVVQRLCQLTAFVLAGKALGVAGLGVLAQGQALAAILCVLTGAGVGNTAARALAADPAALRTLALVALRRRLAVGVLLAATTGAIASATSTQPGFWWLCALQVLPGAIDLKPLFDAAGRTRRDVGIETATAGMQLLAVFACVQGGAPQLATLAAILLACRLTYAIGALRTLVNLPRGKAPPRPRARPSVWVALGQMAHELLAIGDVWLVAIALGDAAAGYYAVGVRFAAAALLPSAQLTRLLFPHMLHANAAGDAARALGTALRATLLVTLPVFAGGIACADGLCHLVGDGFAAAAPVLVCLLAAGSLQHLGWQCSSALLAGFRDRAYGHGFAWPAICHAAAIGLLPQFAWPDPAAAALVAALVAVVAMGAYATTGLWSTGANFRRHTGSWWHAPMLAAGVGAAAALPKVLVDGAVMLPLQLAAGGLAFALGLWWLELRGRWRRVGDGLATASGFLG